MLVDLSRAEDNSICGIQEDFPLVVRAIRCTYCMQGMFTIQQVITRAVLPNATSKSYCMICSMSKTP